ncbi:MAG: ABC transporter permease [Bdellovibrionales bacterium]|nr:ABC transporter permease [Bdellovibrionales bacterium]
MRRKNFSLVCGSSLVALFGASALLAPWLPIADPRLQNLARQLEAPSWQHPFGLGENGVDLLAQVIWGARLSLFVAGGSVLIAAIIGLVLGSLAGYLRGKFDLLLMRCVEVLYAFPGLLLVVALAAVLGPSVRNMMLVLILTSWAGYARLVRGVTLSLRERDYVQAARSLGSSLPRILVVHLWPNILPALIVQMTFGLGSAILTESSLSFLGLGASAGTPSWGQLLNEGREAMTSASHALIVPGLALVLAIWGLNLLGDGLRDWLDPRFRTQV